MDVSIIIVTYNTCKLTKECIESIIKYTSGINYEIILVDNNSKDGSIDTFESDSRIKYIYSHENLGFGRANNLGAKSATGKYLFFQNSDTLLTSNVIREFYESMELRTDIAVMGGQLLWPNGSLQESYFKFPTLGMLFWDCLGLLCQTPKNPDKSDSIVCLHNKFISGADLFISRDLFNQIGGFYQGFFMYYEETDLQLRIIKQNLKIAFNPSLKIIHYNGGSQNTKVYDKSEIKRRYTRKIKNFNISRLLYFRRNHPRKIFLLKCILTFGIILRLFRLADASSLIKEIWRKP